MVNVYANGVGAEKFGGVFDNTEIYTRTYTLSLHERSSDLRGLFASLRGGRRKERRAHSRPTMEYSSCRSNLLKELLYCRIRDRKINNENTAEIPCAIKVARAARCV